MFPPQANGRKNILSKGAGANQKKIQEAQSHLSKLSDNGGKKASEEDVSLLKKQEKCEW
jgi:hypothetical protein